MTEPAPMLRAFDAMGTRFECVLAAFARPVRPSEATAVAEEIESIVADWHGRLSVFDRGSVISTINERAAQQTVALDSELFGLLARCLGYSRETGGAFDIAAGTLMHRFGFRGPGDRPAGSGTAGGDDAVLLDAGSSCVQLASGDVRLDLGGIAKGFVLDLVCEELAAQGVSSAIVQGGTSSGIGMGLAPDGSPWRVRLTRGDPEAPVIELTDRAFAFSSPAGRTHGGHGHIMDPRSGCPAAGAQAACVVGPSAEVCEAWSTALVVDPDLAGCLPLGYESHLRRSGVWSSSMRHSSEESRSLSLSHSAAMGSQDPRSRVTTSPEALHHV